MKVELLDFKEGLLRILPEGLKGEGETPIKKLSDSFSEILYPVYERAYSVEEYYKGVDEQKHIVITGKVIFDIDQQVNYVLYKTILPPIFNSEFVLTDGHDLFGIDAIKFDQEETNKDGQFYHFRIYVGKRTPIGENFYVMKNPLSLMMATNEGITLSAFNSKRVNESLKRNIKHFIANRNSLETLNELGRSLEATVNIFPLSIINDEIAQILIKAQIPGLVTILLGGDEFLFSGSIYPLRFDDYRLDFVPREKSFVVVSEKERLLDINRDMVIFNVDSGAPGSWTASGNQLIYECPIIDLDEFYTRMGNTTKWFIEIMGGMAVFTLNDIDHNFNSGVAQYEFQFSSGQPLSELSGWENGITIKYNFRQDRSSRRTRYCIFELLVETNSSEKKMMLDVYQYNLDILKKFLSDRIEILGTISGYTGTDHLFKGSGQYEKY